MFLVINTAVKNQMTAALVEKSFQVVRKKTKKIRFSEPEKLLPLIDAVLSGVSIKKIRGVIVVTGPGGFSSLRAGITVANIFGWSLHIPVVGLSLFDFKNFKELVKIGERRLNSTKKFRPVLPYYGKEPNITMSA